MIQECFLALLNQLYRSHLPIVTAAADCLIGFAQNSSLWWNQENDVRIFYILIICYDLYLLFTILLFYYYLLINFYHIGNVFKNYSKCFRLSYWSID